MNNTKLINEVIKRTTSISHISKYLFEEYLIDDTITLEERWDTWVNAPDFLKNHELYYIHIDGVDDDLITGCCPDRYATYDVTTLMESLEESEHEKGFDANKAKADMLKRNIGSFCYDW